MKNVLITTSSFNAELLAIIESSGLATVLNPYKRKLTEEEVNYLIQDFQPVGVIAGVEPLTKTVLEKAPFLKVISRCGIGMDSVDMDTATRQEITVTNTPDAPTIPVAELTIGMILALLRSTHISDNSIRIGGWERPMGGLLHGKTVGIIGCGRIGSYVANIVHSFGCRVIGFDPFLTNHDHIELFALDKLLQISDIVTLHIPYTDNNHHLISADRIALMKKGAFLVNAARGGLIDEVALVEALRSESISGAAIDCFEIEPYTGPLAQIKNTLMTAHIGSYAREGRLIMEQQATDNLLNTLRKLKQID